MNGNRILRRDKFLESAILMPIITVNNEGLFFTRKKSKEYKTSWEIFPVEKIKKIKLMQTAIRETVEELGIKKKILLNLKNLGLLSRKWCSYRMLF